MAKFTRCMLHTSKLWLLTSLLLLNRQQAHYSTGNITEHRKSAINSTLNNNFFTFTLLYVRYKHAPIKTKKMVMRPVVSWFTDNLKNLKAERRKCERKMLQSGCSHDKELYYKTRDKYSALLRKTKTSYYSDLIDKCSGNSKKLFEFVLSIHCPNRSHLKVYHLMRIR